MTNKNFKKIDKILVNEIMIISKSLDFRGQTGEGLEADQKLKTRTQHWIFWVAMWTGEYRVIWNSGAKI